MKTPQFIHLRMHSEYSIVDGLVRIDNAIQAAVSDQQPALAITDLSNVFGMVKFYKEARSKGIKPIIGCDVWISNDQQRDKPTRLLLLVKNHSGYLQLCELLTQAWLLNQHQGRAEIRREWLASLTPGGLIALSGAHSGDTGIALENGNMEAARSCARYWAQVFPGHFYVEIQRANQNANSNPTNMAMHVRQSVQLASELDLPVVATHPVQFIHPSEFTAHEARTCIAEGEILANGRRIRRFNEECYFKSQAEMTSLFADLPGALANSVEIAKRCNLVLELGKPKLPLFPTPDGMSLDQFLVSEAQTGLEQRLAQLYPDPTECEQQRPKYLSRLKFETDTISSMGFAGYFLIVAEFISWAKQNGVPVGPGRGSGAGSLVAYALKITDLDPLAYNLLFERFLNPDRVSMPDFDIDFCQEGRDRVIQHVKDLYGKEAVSQIATFGTMAAKGAVRDVGRVLDFGYNFCDGISKLIPFKPGKQVTIAEAIKEEPLLAERQQNEEEVKQLLELAQQVEGITRNVGMHAGGVLIAPGKLTDFCPLYTQGGETGVISQLDKDDVEAIGLVKFDFLGLTTLTILNWAVRYINTLDPAAKFSLEQAPLDDSAVYTLLSKAKTVAVFQLESRGMQGMLKDAKPDRFEDIIALVALYRPGPMDLIPDFCRRKHGEAFSYPDPRTESILSETYGIMVYQEQVMQMAQVVGGYSLGGADLLRRAMGKKKLEEMAEQRQTFRQGAAKNGLTEQKADEIFDLMEKFAGYGFNKSHAAAYALLAYHTAYLKVHHPAAFMAANLSLAMDDTDKVKILVEDAVNVCGLTLLPPDVNYSEYRFVPAVNQDGKPATHIRYGLGAVKGSGQQAIENIVAVRADGPFVDLFDFTKRVDKRQVNRRTIEALIRSGAFDCFNVDRGVLLASVGLAIEYAEQAEAARNQGSLFGDDIAMSSPPDYEKVPAWSEKRKLAEEKSALGYYLSGHLFSTYAKEVRKIIRTPLAKLEAGREAHGTRQAHLIAGVISAIRTQMTQRGKIVIVTLDDSTATQEVTVYSELYDEFRHYFKEDEFLAVSGRVSEDRFSGGLRVTAEKLMDIAQLRIQYGQALQIKVHDSFDVKQLQTLLAPHVYEQGCPLVVHYCSQAASVDLRLADHWRVLPNDELQQKLTELLSPERVAVVYG